MSATRLHTTLQTRLIRPDITNLGHLTSLHIDLVRGERAAVKRECTALPPQRYYTALLHAYLALIPLEFNS
jgi:hypothetical protein